MAKYLVEDEVGFDSELIGFPKLGGCMAVVLQTDQGLYGFHITPGNARKSPGFALFIQNNGLHGNPVHLYGSCYWNNRYLHAFGSQKSQWEKEMKEIATAIGYHGPASGFDTSAAMSHADKAMNRTTKTHSGSNYVEYRRVAATNKCRIFYKKNIKMALTFGNVDLADPVQKVIPMRAKLGAFDLVNSAQITTAAHLAATATVMHEAGFFGKHSFTIP